MNSNFLHKKIVFKKRLIYPSFRAEKFCLEIEKKTEYHLSERTLKKIAKLKNLFIKKKRKILFEKFQKLLNSDTLLVLINSSLKECLLFQVKYKENSIPFPRIYLDELLSENEQIIKDIKEKNENEIYDIIISAFNIHKIISSGNSDLISFFLEEQNKNLMFKLQNQLFENFSFFLLKANSLELNLEYEFIIIKIPKNLTLNNN